MKIKAVKTASEMRFTDLIYLDPAMISEAYTEIRGVSPTTKLSKSEDLGAKINSGVFNLGGTIKETREFAISTTQMFFSIEQKLRELPVRSAPEAFVSNSLFWNKGFLGVGKHVLSTGSTMRRELYFFTIGNEEADPALNLDLAAKDEYFTSGYDRMAAEKEMFSIQIREPVEALLRPSFSNSVQQLHVFTPIVILRKHEA